MLFNTPMLYEHRLHMHVPHWQRLETDSAHI